MAAIRQKSSEHAATLAHLNKPGLRPTPARTIDNDVRTVI